MNQPAMSLAQKIVSLHRSFEAAKLVHAFGGAFALAYCTQEPRGTRDIDVNVFIPPEHLAELLNGLPPAVAVTATNKRQMSAEGQSRLWWGETPVDIFLSNHSFHDQVAANRRFVPFAEVERLPVLACSDLAMFEVFFGRSRDSVDVAAMVAAGAVDLRQLERDAATLLGDVNIRAEFFARVRSAVPDFAATEHDREHWGQK